MCIIMRSCKNHEGYCKKFKQKCDVEEYYDKVIAPWKDLDPLVYGILNKKVKWSLSLRLDYNDDLLGYSLDHPLNTKVELHIHLPLKYTEFFWELLEKSFNLYPFESIDNVYIWSAPEEDSEEL
jgi:hypothetical protein